MNGYKHEDFSYLQIMNLNGIHSENTFQCRLFSIEVELSPYGMYKISIIHSLTEVLDYESIYVEDNFFEPMHEHLFDDQYEQMMSF